MNILNSLSKESAQKYLRYNELDYAMGELLNKEDFDEKLYAKYEAESDRLYKELWDKEWFRTLLDIKNVTEIPRNFYRSLYFNTAGEIEARDVQQRLNLNAEQRQKKRPDIDRDEVVFSGQNGESFEIREIDRYTERQYNNYGWAIVNHVLTGKEQSKLFAQFADKENLNVRYRKSYDGYYMIPVGEYYSYNNKIVFIDGTNQNPIIDRILFVTGDSEYEIGCYVDEVIENEGQLQLLSYIEDYAGKEIFKWNTLSNFETFGRIKEARQRYSTTSSKNTNENRERERGSQERDGFVNKKSIDDTIKDNDLRFAVDDEITDDLFSFDGDLFEEDNTKYLDEYIKTSPQEAVLSMYNSLAKTGENKKAAGLSDCLLCLCIYQISTIQPSGASIVPI